MDRVLILDDDVDVANLMADVVRRAGYDVKVTLEPTAFFDCVNSWRPNCLILDLIMPTQDGVEVIRRLAGMNSNVRIIVVSGADKRVIAAAARAATEQGLTVAATLAKPFSIHRLTELVQHAFYLGSPQPVYQSVLDQSDALHGNPFEITEQSVREALDKHEIELTFQPQICCHSHALKGFEILARWCQPQAGYISPDHFIPAFERYQMMPALTRSVFEQSLDWFVGLRLSGQAERIDQLSLGINLSVRTFTNLEFADQLRELCTARNIVPQQVVFELTDTSASSDPTLSLDFLTRLRMMGFRLSINDFGSGHSSMSELVRLPFCEIKVDRRFVSSVATSSESKSVVKSIVDLGGSLGLRTVAEGVEDRETLDFLSEVGCDMAQGYFICCPLPGKDVPQWINNRMARSRKSRQES